MSHRMKHLVAASVSLAFVSLAGTACKKEQERAPEASSASGPASASSAKPAEVKRAEAGPFAGWDLAARRAAFQGAHVTPGGALGAWEAWNVVGDKVTIWDGTTEKTLELQVVSPCEAKIIERTPDGATMGTTSHYTLLDGKLAKGLGDAGSRRGPEAIACISNKVFTVDAKGACTEWRAPMFDNGRYESTLATCGFRKDGDREVFVATVHGSESVLEVHGDALLSAQLAQSHSEKVADFAAAKAARDAKK